MIVINCKCGALLLALGLGLASACGAGAAPDDPSAPARGAVLILVDTLRADHLSSYGYGRQTSPSLDRLASEGTRFAYCISQSSWTKPATASVLTGLYPAEHGATQVKARLPEGVETVAERLRSRGVATAGFYANPYASKKHGLHQGFSVYEKFGPEEPTSSAIVDAALAFLDDVGERQFFCYLHLADPHAPYFPAAPFDALFESGYQGSVKGDFGLNNPEHDFNDLNAADIQHLVDLYDGSIAQMDDQVGRFVAGLKQRELFESCLLILVADHGEEFNDHGGFRHNGKLFGEVTQVPLLVKFPGADSSLVGRVYEPLVQQIDLAPTIFGAFGMSPMEAWLGRDLRPLVRADRDQAGEAYGIIEVDTNGVFRKAVVGGGLKYVRAWAPREEEFLYDLREDPKELNNLMLEAPERAELHRSILERFLLENQKGLSILIQNGGTQTILAEVTALTRREFPRAWPFYTEEHRNFGQDRDQRPEFREIEVDGEKRMGVRVRLRVAAGDGDGIRLETMPGEEELELMLRIDGQAADPTYLRLGTSDQPSADLPHILSLPADASYGAPMFEAQANLGGDPYRMRIWSALDLTPLESLELTKGEEDAFRALGYLGGDED